MVDLVFEGRDIYHDTEGTQHQAKDITFQSCKMPVQEETA